MMPGIQSTPGKLQVYKFNFDHKLSIIFYVLFVVMASSGCVPVWIHNFYQPIADQGVVEQSWCGGTSCPNNTVQFIKDEVIFRVSSHHYQNNIFINLSLEIPDKRIVSVNFDIVYVITNPNTFAYPGTFKPNINPGRVHWNIGDNLIGKTNSFYQLFSEIKYGTYYSMSATVFMPEVNEFNARLPDIKINGNVFTLPTIVFRNSRTFEFFAPLNC